MSKKTLQQRFWEKVNKTDGCWEWQGNINSKGYGRITINGKPYYANRLSWIIHNGEIPKGMFVCHKCDNPPCVNPKHLFLGTAKDNAEDRDRKGRWYSPGVRGEQHGRSKLTKQQVLTIRELCDKKVASYEKIAEIFNIRHPQVSRIANRKLWRHI